MTTSERYNLHKDITRCFLCFETFNVPRLLPCLHSFCEECLQGYINGNVRAAEEYTIKEEGLRKAEGYTIKKQNYTSFGISCPLCRTFVEKSEGIESTSWAKKFPSNFLFDIVKAVNLEIEGLNNCSVCERENEDKIAIYWCGNCNDALCESCERQHRRFQSTNSHHVVKYADFNNASPSHIFAEMTCKEHKEVYKYYCSDHSQICCMTCVVLQHRQCHSVMTVEKAAEDKRKCKNEELLKKDLEALKESYQAEVEDNTRITNELAQKLKTTRYLVNKYYDDLISHFTKAKSLTLNELHVFEKQNLPRTLSQKIDFESRVKGLDNNLSFLLLTSKHGSSVQYLYTLNKLAYQKDLLELFLQSSNDTGEAFDIHFTPHDSLSEILNSNEALGSMSFFRFKTEEEADTEGKSVSAQTALTNSTHEHFLDPQSDIDKSNDANVEDALQLTSTKQFGHEQRKTMETTTTTSLDKNIDIRYDFVKGVAILDDGRILLSKSGEEPVLLLDRNGGKLSSLHLENYIMGIIPISNEGNTAGIKMISQTEGAVVVEGKCLQFFKVTGDDILKDGKFNHPVKKDFTLHKNHYYIGCDKKITVFNTSIHHVRDIAATGTVYSIAVRADKSLCYTVMDGRELYCITTDGNAEFTYSHDELQCTTGVTVDPVGYIYVCGCISKNIHQLTCDGKLQRIIIENLPTNPFCISFNTIGDKALVGCWGKVLLYDFTRNI